MQSLGLEVLFKGKNFARLLGGLWTALQISLISIAISMALGTLLGILVGRKNGIGRVLMRCYLEFIHIMPQMVLLFIVFFGFTKLTGLNLSAEVSAVIVFSFWGTAEMADLVRGCMISIPVIQYESSMALGMSRLQTFVYVIVPQIIRRLLPLSINLITRMIKTTSLVMMIGIVEVLKVGQQIIEANRRTAPNAAFGVFAVVFLLYFLVCWPISCLSKYLEKKWEN